MTKLANVSEKDFSYRSGERQTSFQRENIREDHLNRYIYAAERLQELYKGKQPERIGDIFCGNGYGTAILAEALPSTEVLAIDGSEEAVNVGKTHYARSNTRFESRIFPFSLETQSFDAIVCYESIEHVMDSDSFFNMIASAIKPNGYLFVSTPNDEVMPYEENKNIFKHHFRHFSSEEVLSLAENNALTFLEERGQSVYVMDGQKVNTRQTVPMGLRKSGTEHQFCLYVFQK